MAFVFDYGLVGLWCGILTGVVVTGECKTLTNVGKLCAGTPTVVQMLRESRAAPGHCLVSR